MTILEDACTILQSPHPIGEEKSVTAMSPLQFQKQLRLQEARRLLLGEDVDAASAGFRVGYEDPSYFSREYKKLFGAPPQRDIAKLRSNLAL